MRQDVRAGSISLDGPGAILSNALLWPITFFTRPVPLAGAGGSLMCTLSSDEISTDYWKAQRTLAALQRLEPLHQYRRTFLLTITLTPHEKMLGRDRVQPCSNFEVQAVSYSALGPTPTRIGRAVRP